jgi:hypothetical protein
MPTYETDLAIQLDGVSEEVKHLADAAENSSLSSEEFANQILEVISQLSQIANEFAQR